MAQTRNTEPVSPRRQPNRRPKSGKPKASNVINIRADAATRALIDGAAEKLGQNRTEFMLGIARARAQEVLLSQTHIVLSDADWSNFQKALEAPPAPTEELVKLLASRAPWSD